MNEVSLAEVVRRLDALEHRRANDDARFVLAAVYQADVIAIKDDVNDIKSDVKWATRLVIVQLFGAALAVAVWALTSG